MKKQASFFLLLVICSGVAILFWPGFNRIRADDLDCQAVTEGWYRVRTGGGKYLFLNPNEPGVVRLTINPENYTVVYITYVPNQGHRYAFGSGPRLSEQVPFGPQLTGPLDAETNPAIGLAEWQQAHTQRWCLVPSNGKYRIRGMGGIGCLSQLGTGWQIRQASCPAGPDARFEWELIPVR